MATVPARQSNSLSRRVWLRPHRQTNRKRIGWLIRMTYDSKGDRDKEDAAREYLAQHGHWPGEGKG